MKNLKIGKILSSGQKQGENAKIEKFPRELGRLGSYEPFNSKNFPLFKCQVEAIFVVNELNSYLETKADITKNDDQRCKQGLHSAANASR